MTNTPRSPKLDGIDAASQDAVMTHDEHTCVIEESTLYGADS
ncbi:MAG: hypothetical protein R3C02_24955 [Planctomycetaceae bacterium]